MTITNDFPVIIVSFSHTSSCSFEIVNIVGSGRRTRQHRRIRPENSSTSSDLAGELVSVIGSGRKTHQRRRIWPENSLSSSDLAGELVSVVGSVRRTRQRRRIWPENTQLLSLNLDMRFEKIFGKKIIVLGLISQGYKGTLPIKILIVKLIKVEMKSGISKVLFFAIPQFSIYLLLFL